MALTTWQPSQWADLLPELLGRVIARLPFPDDLARFRAVCRPWHSAVREHARPGLPWVLHSDGTFVTHDYGFHRRVPFPDNTRFVGANGSWLALYRTDGANGGRRSYLLHNPFTKTTVPLPGLDSVIGKVHDRFKIRKVLMRSDQDDIIAVTTNSRNYPLILCRPGKPGAWFPEQGDVAYASINDIAFHGGNLYGITYDKELVMLGLDEDEDGIPTVASAGCVIEYMPGDDEAYEEEANEDGGEASSNEDEEEAEYSDMSSFDEEGDEDGESSSNDDEEEADYDEGLSSLDAGDDDHEDFSSNEDEEDALNLINGLDDYEANNFTYYEGDGLMPERAEFLEDGYYEHGGDMPNEPMEYIFIFRYLIESNGKLLMLRRRERTQHCSDSYILDVEVLEANLGTCKWVPTDMAGRLYVSDRNSKYVSALSDEYENELAFYFVDEHDEMDPESQTPDEIMGSMATWFFPRELVV